MTDIRQFVRAYIPTSRNGRTLVTVAMTDSVGTGLYLSGSVLYFVRGIGLSATGVGTGLAIAGLIGLLTTVPLGLLGDRFQIKRMLMALQTWRALMLLLLAFVTDLGGFVIGAIGLTIAARSATPATQAVVGAVMTGPDRVATMAIMRSIRNVGYSLGALLTVPIFAVDSLWAYRVILLTNAATFLGSVVLLIPLRVPATVAATVAARSRYPAGVRDWRFLLLSLLNGFFSLHTSILSIGIPLWALAAGAPRWIVSVTFVVNTALAVLLQVASTRGSDQPGFGERALRRSAFALLSCCLLFSTARLGDRYVVVAALVLGAVAMTGGELWQSAGSWELAFRLSPRARQAEYLAAFNLGPAGSDILGPLLMTAVVARGAIGWVLLAGLFAIAAVLVRPTVAANNRHQVSWEHIGDDLVAEPVVEAGLAPLVSAAEEQ